MTPALCNRKAFPNFPRPNSNLDSIAWNFVNIYSKVKLLHSRLNSKDCESYTKIYKVLMFNPQKSGSIDGVGWMGLNIYDFSKKIFFTI